MIESVQESVLDATEARQIRAYVDNLILANIKPPRIAVESGVPIARLKSWLAGSDDGGDILPTLAAWKAEDEQAAALNSGFVMTPTAKRIIQAFDCARQSKGGVSHMGGERSEQRGIALVYGASGAGKSETAAWYMTQNNAKRTMGIWPVVVVRCTGAERTIVMVQDAIIASLKEAGYYLQSHEKKLETIINHVSEGGIIIFDEAQLLPARRMDELRYFPDRCGIAIAFMGNLSGYTDFVNAKMAQITSRVGGDRVVIQTPCEGDVDALLDAWEIRGREVRTMAVMIGTQDGGLRLLVETVRAAKIYAKAAGRAIDIGFFKAGAVAVGAWGNAA